ncbi:hypothetical protein DSM107010_33870 [Chroococcidiopsis cubana SAG 39.79]|uniref:Uncharacterized protein n=1 Tax=Chroococcidiopsis cubana SAG 39.79 TaxID=388085 RepID=A0AB37UIZ7_9CYAN|nr:hypothetical protein DSM107010_33870 [Chroococcidiopsis cubana SAG 39.79]
MLENQLDKALQLSKTKNTSSFKACGTTSKSTNLGSSQLLVKQDNLKKVFESGSMSQDETFAE